MALLMSPALYAMVIFPAKTGKWGFIRGKVSVANLYNLSKLFNFLTKQLISFYVPSDLTKLYEEEQFFCELG